MGRGANFFLWGVFKNRRREFFRRVGIAHHSIPEIVKPNTDFVALPALLIFFGYGKLYRRAYQTAANI